MSGPTPQSIELRNRLGEETSPYLLQHRNNPVHWFAWGPEAFEAARVLDRPIFLSVGYSTCYWCHVMERESFEDERTAALMNEHFVCIKVDREERPDVDDIYMTAVQLLTRHGGWPMSVFLEPQSLKPFLGGTYFPPVDGPGRPSFTSVLQQVADLWATRRDDLLRQGNTIAQAIIEQNTAPTPSSPAGRDEVERAVSQVMSGYDSVDGGFTGSPQRAPKFPVAPTLDFLIGPGWDEPAVRSAVLYTLDRMAIGGMYDQIGGGFHRYSTDASWLVPHFEKMLYDNGQLASVYARAFELTGDPFYAQVVRETLDYVLREMTASSGAFNSAQDAEVNHREGENYLWTAAEIRAALDSAGLGQDVDFVTAVYGLDQGTNFQDPHHREDAPKNVIFLAERPEAMAKTMAIDPKTFDRRLAGANEALRAVRDKRDQPLTDDKIIAGWNGLMIAGFADGGRVLDEPRYVTAAERAATFILEKMRSADGSLLRTARDGKAKIDAFLEDYAFVIRGLLALERATGSKRFLDAAVELAAQARAKFWDQQNGGYYDTLAAQSDLFVRIKSTYDGATPSGNSVMINNLIDLAEMTADRQYLEDARKALAGLSEILRGRPSSAVLSMLAVDRLLQEPTVGVAEAAPDEVEKEAVTLGPAGYRAVDPLTIAASTRVVEVSPSTPGSFEIILTLAPGHHVNSHQPGIDYLIPLNVSLEGGEGLQLQVEYPPGERYQGPEGNMAVHQGRVVVPVRIEQTGRLTGRPRVMLTFQICTDQVCLAPETRRVPVAIIEKK